MACTASPQPNIHGQTQYHAKTLHDLYLNYMENVHIMKEIYSMRN